MVIFHDPVSRLQAFGYSIALGGLVFYKLGGAKIREFVSTGGRAWAEYGAQRPVLRKLLVFGMALTGFLFLVSMFGGYLPTDYDPTKLVKDYAGKYGN